MRRSCVLRSCLKSLLLSLRGREASCEPKAKQTNLLCEPNMRLLRRSADAELLAMTLFRHALRRTFCLRNSASFIAAAPSKGKTVTL
jgi:hypothetical protein